MRLFDCLVTMQELDIYHGAIKSVGDVARHKEDLFFINFIPVTIAPLSEPTPTWWGEGMDETMAQWSAMDTYMLARMLLENDAGAATVEVQDLLRVVASGQDMMDAKKVAEKLRKILHLVPSKPGKMTLTRAGCGVPSQSLYNKMYILSKKKVDMYSKMALLNREQKDLSCPGSQFKIHLKVPDAKYTTLREHLESNPEDSINVMRSLVDLMNSWDGAESVLWCPTLDNVLWLGNGSLFASNRESTDDMDAMELEAAMFEPFPREILCRSMIIKSSINFECVISDWSSENWNLYRSYWGPGFSSPDSKLQFAKSIFAKCYNYFSADVLNPFSSFYSYVDVYMFGFMLWQMHLRLGSTASSEKKERLLHLIRRMCVPVPYLRGTVQTAAADLRAILDSE
jgi:hypothetical protein